MSVLKKSKNGLLYYEDFSDPNSLMWTLSPSHMSNVLEFGVKGPVVNEKGLRIKHSDKYVTYTMPEPSDRDEFGVIFDLHHVPLSKQDIGGVIVIGNTNQYIECQTYLATGPSEIINSEHFLEDVKVLIGDEVKKYMESEESEEEEDPNAESEEQQEEQYEYSEYENPNSLEGYIDTVYRYIKLYKIKHKYYFYASPDSINWIEVGNVSMDTSAGVGLFLYAVYDDQNTLDNGRFKCENLAFYSSRFISFYGIDTTKEFEIKSNGKVIFRTDSSKYLHMRSRDNRRTILNTTELPTPIKDAELRVYPRNNYDLTYLRKDLGDLWGGDVFELMNDIRLFIEDYEHPVTLGEHFDLGMFYKNETFIKIIVHNYDSETAESVKMTVSRQSIYYGGDEFVLLGLFDENHPTWQINYSRTLIIPKIEPSEGVIVYAKLCDNPTQDAFMKANDYRFKITIE